METGILSILTGVLLAWGSENAPATSKAETGAASPGAAAAEPDKPVAAIQSVSSGASASSAFRPLEPILRRHADRAPFALVLAAPETYRVQVLISEVVLTRNGKRGLERFGYRADAEYFYPASAIKLGAAVAALHLVEELRGDLPAEVFLEAPIEFSPLFPGDAPAKKDATNLKQGQITLAHELRKLAYVSDNQAFNRLFDLAGHEGLNKSLRDLGFASLVINHRLSDPRRIPDPQASPAASWRVSEARVVRIPARSSELMLSNAAPGLRIGTGYWAGTNLVNSPMDFTRRNGISLADLQNLLIKLARPDIDAGGRPLAISGPARAALLQALTDYPRESANPIYAAERFPDDSNKFLLPGIRRVFPSTEKGERVEVTGKVGQAYGFTVENAYLYHPGSQRALFVTAVIYTNRDGILNDDRYEYGAIAEPFMADLGEVIAREWLNRQP